MKISLCLIVWNEINGCKIDIVKINRKHFHEIFAIDGGSVDGTVDFLQKEGIKIYPQEYKGLNSAYVQANKIASGDYVVAFFPKGTISTSYLESFSPLFKQGYQLVIASRQIKGSLNEEDSKFIKPRKWLVKILAFFVAILWKKEGNFIFDVLHGVKGWNRKSFERMRILNRGLSVDVEMVIRSYKLKLSRVEFPVIELATPYGKTHFRIWPTGKKLIKYLFFEIIRND